MAAAELFITQGIGFSSILTLLFEYMHLVESMSNILYKECLIRCSINSKWKGLSLLMFAPEFTKIYSRGIFEEGISNLMSKCPILWFFFAVRNVHYRGCFRLLKSITGTFPIYSYQPNLTTQSCIETCTDKVWVFFGLRDTSDSPFKITQFPGANGQMHYHRLC